MPTTRYKHPGFRRKPWRRCSSSRVEGILSNIQGESLEIEAVFEPGDSAEFGFILRCSPDGEEQTRLVYDSAQERLIVEPDQSSLSTVVDRDMRKVALSLGDDGLLKLHIFLDRSVLEVYANEHTCLVSRIYPTRIDSLGLDLFTRSGSAKLKSLNIWEMKSIWDWRSLR